MVSAGRSIQALKPSLGWDGDDSTLEQGLYRTNTTIARARSIRENQSWRVPRPARKGQRSKPVDLIDDDHIDLARLDIGD
jgi:hypothetical protein